MGRRARVALIAVIAVEALGSCVGLAILATTNGSESAADEAVTTQAVPGAATEEILLRARPGEVRVRVVPGVPADDEGTASAMVHVRVETPDGHGIDDAQVGVVEANVLREWQRTDADGSITTNDFPVDGTIGLCAFGSRGWTEPVQVTSPEVQLRVSGAIPFMLDVVDAETGGEIAGETAGRAEASGRARSRRTWILGRGHTLHIRPWAPAPDGYVGSDVSSPNARTSLIATALTAVYPLRREANVTLSALDEAGKPAELLTVLEAFVLGSDRTISVTAESESPGIFRLRGIPFFRGATIALRAAEAERESFEERVLFSGSSARPPPSGPGAAVFALAGEASDCVRASIVIPPEGPREQDCYGSCCGGMRTKREAEGPRGTLQLRGRRRNGASAAGAIVILEAVALASAADGYDASRRQYVSLDDDGRAEASLFVGTWRVLFDEPGMVPSATEVHVRDNDETWLDLYESRGGTIQVQVVDASDRACPFATVLVEQASHVTWADLSDEGVQRLDSFVDVSGRRTLTHVEAGEVHLRVMYGVARKDFVVEVKEGAVVEARIEIEQPSIVPPSETGEPSMTDR